MPNFGILLGRPSATDPHKLPFKDVLRVAELLAERFKVLSDKLPYPLNPGLDPRRVKEIRTALRALNGTPNGSVSRETLDQWISELTGFRDQLAAWCEGLVTFRHPEDHGKPNGKLLDEEIPF